MSGKRRLSPKPVGPGAVTIATNMAGRGVDILLGGNPEGLVREQLRKEDFDLATIPQLEWNDALEMLKHGQRPTSATKAVGPKCCKTNGINRGEQAEGAASLVVFV